MNEMKKFKFYSLIVLITAIFCLGINPAAMAKSQKLKAVSFLPKDHPLCKMIHVWVDRVNTECNDAVNIDWLGGGEVIPKISRAAAGGVIDGDDRFAGGRQGHGESGV